MKKNEILNKLNLILVDDDVESLSVLKTILENYFYSIKDFSDSKLALNYILDNPNSVDVIISDLRMPNISGIDICKSLTNNKIDIPILILSSHSDSEELIELIKYGLVDYVVKPITSLKLEKSLDLICEKFDTEKISYLNKNIMYDYENKSLYIDNKVIDLSEKEVLFVELLFKNINKLITKSQLEYYVYENEVMTDNAYRNLIWRLRKKLPQLDLKTVKNFGITLEMN